MPAYLLARINVTDPKQYAEYTKVTPGVIAQHGGRFLVRGGQTTTLEGPPETARIVVIEFPTHAAAQGFYQSPQYQAAKLLRAGAATGQFLIVDGVPPG
jgi:uncharacterized protein (DUF1330 family)